MRLLLDTHVLLWQLSGDRGFGDRAREAIASAAEILISVVSFAEIGVKAAIGKLVVPEGIDAHIRETGVRVLPLSASHGLDVARLPLHHRDPFDRLLVAQARREQVTIVTADARIAAYEVPVLDPFA